MQDGRLPNGWPLLTYYGASDEIFVQIVFPPFWLTVWKTIRDVGDVSSPGRGYLQSMFTEFKAVHGRGLEYLQSVV